jgi:hypothetical protein
MKFYIKCQKIGKCAKCGADKEHKELSLCDSCGLKRRDAHTPKKEKLRRKSRYEA